MGLVEKKKLQIPLEELENVDELFFRQIQMDEKKAAKKFGNFLDETKKEIYSNLKGEGVLDSFKLDRIEEDKVYLEGGECIPSKMMARVFAKSEEIVICAITMHGYDEMEASADEFMREFFYDGWGTALAESAFAWLKNQIKDELLEKQIYSTCSWSPGQHNVDIELQRVVFRMIQPEEIGIKLNDSCMMWPKKSISGFFGIGREKNIEDIRACDFCEHRETCPSAYATPR